MTTAARAANAYGLCHHKMALIISGCGQIPRRPVLRAHGLCRRKMAPITSGCGHIQVDAEKRRAEQRAASESEERAARDGELAATRQLQSELQSRADRQEIEARTAVGETLAFRCTRLSL